MQISDKKTTQKTEMSSVTFGGSLYKTYAVLCSKIAVVHAIQVNKVQTWIFFIFSKFFVLCQVCWANLGTICLQ